MSAPEAATTLERELPRGVYRTSWGNRLWAQVWHGGRPYYLGTFGTPEEAAEARSRALEELRRQQP